MPHFSFALPLSALLAVCFLSTISAEFTPFNTGLGDLDGAAVVCFGDLNSDKHADVFTAKPSPCAADKNKPCTTIQAYLWTSSGSKYALGPSAEVPGVAVGAFANDVDRDGRLDVLVFSAADATAAASATSPLSVSYLRGDLDTLTLTPLKGFEDAAAPIGQPAAFDYDNDFFTDFIGTSSLEGALGKRTVWRNKGSFTDAGEYEFEAYPVGEPTQGQFAPEDPAAAELVSPWGHVFADVNGDCMADMLLLSGDASSPKVEMWVNNNRPPKGEGAYKLARTLQLPAGAAAAALADVDADGALDLVFPVCLPGGAAGCGEKSELHVVYNQQKPMCSSPFATGGGCRKQQNQCTRDDDFKFEDPRGPAGAHHIILPLDGTTLRASPAAPSLRDPPLALRIGDANNDGLPDILLPVVDKNGVSRMQLWRNVACSRTGSFMCGSDAVTAAAAAAANRHGFVYQASDNAGLTEITGAYAAGFIDIGNSGHVDLVVMQDAPKQLLSAPALASASPAASLAVAASAGNVVVHSLKNAFTDDAYFLTLMGINGACPTWCSSGPQFPDPRPYGAAAPGATFKFTITSLSGHKSVREVTQLSQSAYLPLQPPYAHSGLGRTANYVEEVFAGFPSGRSSYSNLWVAMIPNAQLVVFPYPIGDPSSWTLELFVSPSKRLFWVCVAFGVTLAALAATIFVFHRKEKADDTRERRARLSSYFFVGQ